MKLEAFRSTISMRLQTAQEGLTDDGVSKPEAIQQIRLPEMRTERSTKEDLLFALLDKHRVQYVDHRRKGGCLWVIGGHELDNIIDQCHSVGFHFKYKTEGSRSTDGRPAWWTKNIFETVAVQMTPEQLQPAVNVSETLSEKLRSRYSENLSECFGVFADGAGPWEVHTEVFLLDEQSITCKFARRLGSHYKSVSSAADLCRHSL